MHTSKNAMIDRALVQRRHRDSDQNTHQATKCTRLCVAEVGWPAARDGLSKQHSTVNKTTVILSNLTLDSNYAEVLVRV